MFNTNAKCRSGELIPNNLAQDLVKAEMGRHPYAKAYFLEGFPREARQVEDFERNVCFGVKTFGKTIISTGASGEHGNDPRLRRGHPPQAYGQ